MHESGQLHIYDSMTSTEYIDTVSRNGRAQHKTDYEVTENQDESSMPQANLKSL